MERLEPDEVKISRPVLRGGWYSNVLSLPGGREGDVEFYKHIDTRRYLRLNDQGLCFREGSNSLEPANLDEELKRVFE